ncbi:actin-related protein 2/3 complex subunit 5-like [Watersipora subatra]|uniref:actin-related protein 2/3 complex subunit 5-like n=1 Tax=Watersipora subatra TaxID=2589382 RepID=UPI00355B3636
MSVNTGAKQFRKVDVDQYDAERFTEEHGDDPTAIGPNESEVNGLLAQNRNAEALKVVLSNPPLNTKDQAIKDRCASLVLRVLSAIRASEMEGAINQLDQPAQDILAKYIYRGFELPKEAVQANLLTWHEKLFAVGGYGCIVRVLTDRKKV